jgi:hypothetical protein
MLDARLRYNLVEDKMVINMDIAVVIDVAYSASTTFKV